MIKPGRKKKDIEITENEEKDTGTSAEQPDLSRLKKTELLEIMLSQGEEIDSLRAQVEELQARLDSREFELSKAGSIAEASLAVTEIFREADKAAMIYLENIRRLAQEGMKK